MPVRLSSVADQTPPTWTDTAVSATIAAIPFVGGSLQVLYDDVRARYAAKAEQTMTAIASNVGEAHLARRLAEDPQLEALFVNAVDAALRTGYEAKRRLLAKVVSAAVLDSARVDESQLIVDTLMQLDAPHIRALERMSREIAETTRPEDEVWWGTSPAWAAESAPIKAALLRTGTAKPSPNPRIAIQGGRPSEGITAFGEAILAELRACDPAGVVPRG